MDPIQRRIRFGHRLRRILRDPADDRRLLPLYDSSDHLHPNDAGYEEMGRAIDLTLFKRNRAGPRRNLAAAAW